MQPLATQPMPATDDAETPPAAGPAPSRCRWLVGLQLALLAAVLAAVYLSPPGRAFWLPGCTFHQLTGLHCPGCGGTRAVYALLHGWIPLAVRCNLLFFVALPYLALVWVRWQIDLWTGRVRPAKMLSTRLAWGVFWGILGFWILRNLPWFPFTLLAPPAIAR